MAAVMNGPGTQEEKQQKMAQVMASLKKSAPMPTARPKPVAKPEVTEDASAGGSGIIMTIGGGGAMTVSSDREGRRSAAAGTVTFSATDGDQRGPIPVTLSLTRQVNGKEQRIIVSGDADFMSNNELKRQGNANFIFSTALFSWLSYGEFPIDTSRPDPKDNRVTVSTDTVDMLKLIFLWILPGILVAIAAILLIRRKRK
jgi:ABC-2 type transport system permease protein